MAEQLRVTLEIGPKGKKSAAVAADWPGLERGAATPEDAVARLLAYVPRYAPVAALAGLEPAFAAARAAAPAVVEQYPGVGSTDFWGISFAFSSFDRQPMTPEELERELALMQACWAFFDQVRGRVSAEMRRGPRGGGKDRDRIVRHTLGSELDWAKKLGLRPPLDELLTPDGLTGYRAAFCDAIRTFHATGQPARTWPLRYVIRHTAYHTLDHAWEMEDKDLTEP